MEGILFFKLYLLFVVLGILAVVTWLICSILVNFIEFNQSSVSKFVHSIVIEIILIILVFYYFNIYNNL